jgi:hypothetical protein
MGRSMERSSFPEEKKNKGSIHGKCYDYQAGSGHAAGGAYHFGKHAASLLCQ